MTKSYETGWDYDEANKTWRPPRPERGDWDIRLAANAIIPTGAMMPYAGSTAPSGWLICDGATFSATTYPALAALLGGTTLPNLKGKVVVGRDAADPDFDVIGETRGSKDAVVVTHNHTQNSHNHTQDSHNHTQNSHAHNVFGLDDSGADGAGSENRKRLASGGPSVGNVVATATATNIATTATNIATTATNIAAGVSGTGANIQPSIVFNYIVKAA